MRILVGHSYRPSREALITAMSPYGCVEFFESSQEGLRCIVKWKPQLVICSETLWDGTKAWQFAHEIVNIIENMSCVDVKSSTLCLSKIPRPYMVVLTATRVQKALCEECGFNEIFPHQVGVENILNWIKAASNAANQSPIPQEEKEEEPS